MVTMPAHYSMIIFPTFQFKQQNICAVQSDPRYSKVFVESFHVQRPLTWNKRLHMLQFLPLHAFSNGAVMPSHGVRLSVCLSVTLVDCDHIRWARWNFITRLTSPMSSLAARKTSAIWCKGNILKFGVEQRWGRENRRFSTDKSSYLRNGER